VTPGPGQVFHKFLTPGPDPKKMQNSAGVDYGTPDPVSSEISDLTRCAHAQSNILHTKQADKHDY